MASAAPESGRPSRAGSRRNASRKTAVPFVLRTPAPTEPEWQYTLGEEVCDWIERWCVLPSGDHIGQPFALMPWQRAWIHELYRCTEDYTLRYTWSLLGVPKGNGKSPLVAALALYHLLGDNDEPDPWVVVSAASDKQADMVFDAAKRICELSPALNAATDRYRWEIQVKGGTGKLERVAASKGKLDGKLISFLVMDELHEWEKTNWTVLTGGALKRLRAQIVQITTAGYDRESVCYQEYEKGLRLATGELKDPSYLFTWFGAPEEAAKGENYRSPAVWEAVNPAWNVIVHEQTLRKVLNQPENDFRRYRLNQWVKAESAWLPPGAWDRCNAGPFELEAGQPAAGAWDASTKRDSTARVLAQARTCDAGRTHYRVKGRAWERPNGPDGQPLEGWRVPMAEVVADIRGCFARYDLSELGMAYDPAFIAWEADELEAGGLLMVEFPQTPTRMVKATAALYELIAVECECGRPRLEHDGDPTLARHISGLQARMVRGGGQMLEKKDRGALIDMGIALAMAVASVNQQEPTEEEHDYGVFAI